MESHKMLWGEGDRFGCDQNSERIPVAQYASISASWEPYKTSSGNINRKQEGEGNQSRECYSLKNSLWTNFPASEKRRQKNNDDLKGSGLYWYKTKILLLICWGTTATPSTCLPVLFSVGSYLLQRAMCRPTNFCVSSVKVFSFSGKFVCTGLEYV